MDIHVWLVFVAASAVMGLAPGPAVTRIVGYALSSGRATALASVAGMAVGNLIAMGLSLGGVGALLSASWSLCRPVDEARRSRRADRCRRRDRRVTQLRPLGLEKVTRSRSSQGSSPATASASATSADISLNCG